MYINLCCSSTDGRKKKNLDKYIKPIKGLMVKRLFRGSFSDFTIYATDCKVLQFKGKSITQIISFNKRTSLILVWLIIFFSSFEKLR